MQASMTMPGRHDFLDQVTKAAIDHGTRKRPVLITGASGFVGRALAQVLVDAGYKVVSLVRDHLGPMPPGQVIVYGDIRNADLCRRIIADYEIGTIYHLAAQAIVSSCAEDPVTAYDVAVMGTARLLQAVRDSGRPIRVVISTSDKVYGSSLPPYDEQTPLDARHPYEASKAMQDIAARSYFHAYGIDVRVVRAVNIYGPGDPNESRLIPQTARRLRNNQPPLLNSGAAGMRRQYVFIDDLVSALRTVCDHGKAGEAYCVGSPDAPMSVLEVMRVMSECAGVPFVEPEVKERAARFHEIAEQSVRDDKLRALGWIPRVSFRDGIQTTLEFYGW